MSIFRRKILASLRETVTDLPFKLIRILDDTRLGKNNLIQANTGTKLLVYEVTDIRAFSIKGGYAQPTDSRCGLDNELVEVGSTHKIPSLFTYTTSGLSRTMSNYHYLYITVVNSVWDLYGESFVDYVTDDMLELYGEIHTLCEFEIAGDKATKLSGTIPNAPIPDLNADYWYESEYEITEYNYNSKAISARGQNGSLTYFSIPNTGVTAKIKVMGKFKYTANGKVYPLLEMRGYYNTATIYTLKVTIHSFSVHKINR